MAHQFITIARPYAKAAFNFAVEHQKVDHWQNMLVFAAEIIRNKNMVKILFSETSSKKDLAKKFLMVCGKQLDQYGQNLIKIMVENDRLNILPYVLKQFIHLRTENESITEVEVISANILKKEHLLKISIAMEKRLLRKVKINCRINQSIVTGVIICYGDMVIDASLDGYLKRIENILQT